MSRTLSPALRRVLALAILLMAPVLAWLVVVQPLAGLVSAREDEITVLAERLDRLRATIRRLPELERNEAASRQRLEAAGGLWTDASRASIAATMADELRQAVAGSHGAVKSTSELQGGEEKGLQAVKLRFAIEGSLETLQATLAAVAAARPAIFVDAMNVVAPGTNGPDKPPRIDFDLEVVGYFGKTGS